MSDIHNIESRLEDCIARYRETRGNMAAGINERLLVDALAAIRHWRTLNSGVASTEVFTEITDAHERLEPQRQPQEKP